LSRVHTPHRHAIACEHAATPRALNATPCAVARAAACTCQVTCTASTQLHSHYRSRQATLQAVLHCTATANSRMDRCVVVVQHATRRSVAAELVVNRRDCFDVITNGLPLRRCGHGSLEVALQSFEPMERHADAVAQQCHHRDRTLVVFRSVRLGGYLRGEHPSAQQLSETLERSRPSWWPRSIVQRRCCGGV